MKKKTILWLLIVCFALTPVLYGFAAGKTFSLNYLGGTSDPVTNLPGTQSGLTGGEAFTVSSQKPKREGFEFIDWTLDYAEAYTLTYHVSGDPRNGNAVPGDAPVPDPVTGIAAGGSVTLADKLTSAWTTLDGQPPTNLETYTVDYLEVGTDRVLAHPKSVSGVSVDDKITEVAIDIDGYMLSDDPEKTLTIRRTRIGRWVFTGWCLDEACTQPVTSVTDITADTDVYGQWRYEVIDLGRNQFVFYYEKRPVVQRTDVTIRYIFEETDEQLCPDDIICDCTVGERLRVYARAIEGFRPYVTYYTFEVEKDMIVIFVYYEDYKI